MPLTAMVLDALARAFGVVTAIAVALAGLWRFWFWWRDRREQTRILSAEFFSKAETDTWRRAFGEQELVRIHFRRLTGVDRRTDYQALIQLHQILGSTDDDWRSLRKAKRFVRDGGRVASVSKLKRGDIVGTVVAVMIGLLLFLGASFLSTFAINLGMAQIGKDARLEALAVLLIAILYAALCFAGMWAAIRFGGGTLVAYQLRKRLLTLRKLHRAKRTPPHQR